MDRLVNDSNLLHTIDCNVSLSSWGCPARFQVLREFKVDDLEGQELSWDENGEESRKEDEQKNHKQDKQGGSQGVEDERNGERGDKTGDGVISSKLYVYLSLSYHC
jgi:hypothetical protein